MKTAEAAHSNWVQSIWRSLLAVSLLLTLLCIVCSECKGCLRTYPGTDCIYGILSWLQLIAGGFCSSVGLILINDRKLMKGETTRFTSATLYFAYAATFLTFAVLIFGFINNCYYLRNWYPVHSLICFLGLVMLGSLWTRSGWQKLFVVGLFAVLLECTSRYLLYSIVFQS
jgi:hypothetical protein